MPLVVRNWKRFQHYGSRRPPWIKLHRQLLDDYEWSCLQVASRALAPCIWLLASESDDGSIPDDPVTLAFRLRTSKQDAVKAVNDMISQGFLEGCLRDASETLATRKRNRCSETEAETEAETEGEGEGSGENQSLNGTSALRAAPKPRTMRLTAWPPDFGLGERERGFAIAGGLDVEAEWGKFRDHHLAKGSRFVDWHRAWRKWCRTAVEYAEQRRMR